MDRIKRISTELLERYPDRFGIDFDENKKLIKEIAIVRSKILRNKIAGYITSRLHREATENKATAIGRSCIIFNKPFASISEILTFLKENAVESKILNPNNILIAINGADSALLCGNDTLVKTGDMVTIVTVVHGGCN